MFKKVVQQGHRYFEARSVHLVREHGKMARTPLVAFFNISCNHSFPWVLKKPITNQDAPVMFWEKAQRPQSGYHPQFF